MSSNAIDSHSRILTPLSTVCIFVLVIAVLIAGVILQEGSVRSPLPFIAAIIVLAGIARLFNVPWGEFQRSIIEGVSGVTIAIFVLVFVGALIGIWIAAGIIPSLVDVGLGFISPSAFLPTAFIFCAITSVATGTSFGTLGTAGVALMSIAAALGIPPAISAGAIISGAYFGDKMSPVSDTTNIAAAMGSIDIFRHIRSMLYTTVPAAVICIIGYWIASRQLTDADTAGVEVLRSALADEWDIRLVHLVPILTMIALALRKIPALIMLAVNVALGVFWAMVFQGYDMKQCLDFIIDGYISPGGPSQFTAMLNRGGITSTYPILLIILAAGGLGGAFKAIGLFRSLFQAFFAKTQSVRQAVLSQIGFVYAIIISTGSMALTLVLPGQVFKPLYKRLGIDVSVMTRTLEDIGTITTPLVPWGGAALFAAGVLEVSVREFAPYVWLSFALPLVSIIYALTGIAIWRESTHGEELSD